MPAQQGQVNATGTFFRGRGVPGTTQEAPESPQSECTPAGQAVQVGSVLVGSGERIFETETKFEPK